MCEAEHFVGPRKHDGTALGGRKREAGWFPHGRVVAIFACSQHTMENRREEIATVSLETFHSLEKARWVI